jgi:hypothetical protein
MKLYKKENFVTKIKNGFKKDIINFKVFLLIIVIIMLLIVLLTTRNLVFVKII